RDFSQYIHKRLTKVEFLHHKFSFNIIPALLSHLNRSSTLTLSTFSGPAKAQK
ncbi:unnamed protein product, partial [marine sediment metagenome]